MTRWILTLFMLAVSFSAYSQASVNGRVVDKERGDALPFATVTVTDKSDNSYVTASAADEKAMFHITGLPVGQYRLVIKYGGYEECSIDVRVNRDGDKVGVGDIRLTKKPPGATQRSGSGR